MKPVTIYTTPTCPYCIRAKRLLDSKGVDYENIDVANDISVRQEMMQKAHGRHTVPQIFIGEFHVGGSDELHALEREGKLDPLLAAS